MKLIFDNLLHMKALLWRIGVCAILLTGALEAQAPPTGLNPAVKALVESISEKRIRASLKTLEGFGTRYILSGQDDPAHGIGAAKRWIYDEFKSYSPRLEVSYQNFRVKRGARRGQVLREVELANVVAVLPGTVRKGPIRAGDRALRQSEHKTEAEVHRTGAVG